MIPGAEKMIAKQARDARRSRDRTEQSLESREHSKPEPPGVCTTCHETFAQAYLVLSGDGLVCLSCAEG